MQENMICSYNRQSDRVSIWQLYEEIGSLNDEQEAFDSSNFNKTNSTGTSFDLSYDQRRSQTATKEEEEILKALDGSIENDRFISITSTH